MKAQIIKIGNSRGIRLPKAVLEQCGFSDEVSLQVKDKKLIVAKTRSPRQGWSKEFERLTKNQDGRKKTRDDLKDFREFGNKWDKSEWG